MPIKRKRRYEPIAPDEILLDAQNLPGFDSNRLEGRIERPIEPVTFRTFFFIIIGLGIIFTFQLAKLQIVDAETLKNRAEANRLSESTLIAERGFITDRYGEPLARNKWNQDLGFSEREYPLAEAAAHVIGYVSYPKRDENGFWFQDVITGVVGIEAAFDDELRGTNGVALRETTAIGEYVSGSVIRPPVNGSEKRLSLDAGLQQELYRAIKVRSEEGGFVGGSGVILDVETGEVYALASYPSFNPHTLAVGAPQEQIHAYVHSSRSPFVDRAISGLYTPGSVVKPFIALAALEENIITPEKEIYSGGSITVPNPYDPARPTVFRDWKAHGWTNMQEAIAVSSDVYFYAIGGGVSGETASQARIQSQEGLGIHAIEKYLRQFGIGSQTGVPLENEGIGIIPTPSWKAEVFDGERWFLGNTYHTAIGQYGFKTTAIQLARATAALANGGYLVNPTLIADTQGAKHALNLNSEHMRVVNEGMLLAVTDGTARAVDIPGLTVAAKTGTAEVGVEKEFINSLLIGFFPYENPRFAFALIMERAKEGTLQGAPAAMRGVLEWFYENRSEMLK